MNHPIPKVDFTQSGSPVVHGKASSYNNHKCRCPECRTAWAAYMAPRIKKYRQNKKDKKGRVQVHVQ